MLYYTKSITKTWDRDTHSLFAIHLFVLCFLLIYIQLSIKFNFILWKCLKRRRYQDFKSLYKVDISRQLVQIDCTGGMY